MINSIGSGSLISPPNMWGASNTTAIASHTHRLPRAPRYKTFHTYGIAERREGCRVPVIEKKLTALSRRAERKDGATSFFFLNADDAIEGLGNYNPIYSGRPKAITMKLLEAAAGQRADNFLSSLCSTGLFYQTPSLHGVRRARMLTSYAGLSLLDHWAEKFPAFKPFVDAYVTKKMRRMIASDCFDMVNGKTPKWMDDEMEKNKLRLIKWEARQYRKMLADKKAAEDKANRDAHMRLLAQQQASLQSQMYYSALNNTPNGLTGGGTAIGQVVSGAVPTPWGK